MGKLLFSCSVPSLSTTLQMRRWHNRSNSISHYKYNITFMDYNVKIFHAFNIFISAQRRQNCPLINTDLSSQTDLYSRSLLTQALTSREGSLASRLIQDRADMLQMELPSLTTRRLALVSFPVGGGQAETAETGSNISSAFPSQTDTLFQFTTQNLSHL